MSNRTQKRECILVGWQERPLRRVGEALIGSGADLTVIGEGIGGHGPLVLQAQLALGAGRHGGLAAFQIGDPVGALVILADTSTTGGPTWDGSTFDAHLDRVLGRAFRALRALADRCGRGTRVVLVGLGTDPADAPSNPGGEAGHGGLAGLVRSLSLEWRAQGTAINGVMVGPGGAATPATEPASDDRTPEDHRWSRVGEVVAFLARPASRGLSGQILTVEP